MALVGQTVLLLRMCVDEVDGEAVGVCEERKKCSDGGGGRGDDVILFGFVECD